MQKTQDRKSNLSRYFSEIRNFPSLTKQEEQSLARNIQRGCRASRDELIQSNLSFVVKVANEYRNLGLPFEDLLNDGNLGLIEAANRYDAGKGTKFITYAIWWIRKSMLKALTERSSLVRVPSYQMKKVREVRDAENSLRKQLGRKPRREEISARLESSLTSVDQILQYSLQEVSLEDRVGKDKDKPISDFLADLRLVSAEDDLIQSEATRLVKLAMHELTVQEKTVVCYRFGIIGGRSLTLRKIGEMMNISRERVRQIEAKAKAKLRKVFLEELSVTAPSAAAR